MKCPFLHVVAACGPGPETLQPSEHPQAAAEGPALQEQAQAGPGQGQDPPRPHQAHRGPGAPREKGWPFIIWCANKDFVKYQLFTSGVFKGKPNTLS